MKLSRRSNATAVSHLATSHGSTTASEPFDLQLAETQIRFAADSLEVMAIFVEAITAGVPSITTVSMALVEGPDVGLFYPLLPPAEALPVTIRPGSTWEAVLMFGESVAFNPEAARSALGTPPFPPFPAAAALKPERIRIEPLISSGRIVGCVLLGFRTTTAPRAAERTTIKRLLRATAARLLDPVFTPIADREPERRRQVLSRLLHDLRTPLSGIGLAAELMELDPPSVPEGIMEAMRTHYVDLLRFLSELEDFAFLHLHPRFPAAQPISVMDALEVVLWRVKPYARRRRQELRIDGRFDRALLASQYHLEQALTAILFDVSACTSEGSTLHVHVRDRGPMASIVVEGELEPGNASIIESLLDPYLRAHMRERSAGLMSLAAAKRAIEYYGGEMSITLRDARFSITAKVPVAP